MNVLEQITKMVSAHPAVHHTYWKGQGKAPLGLYKGMALSYGRVYCKYKEKDPGVLFCATANTHNSTKDVFSYYKGLFEKENLSNENSGVDCLRHLWVLLTGVAMPESSGNCFCGVDVTNQNSLTHEDSAEAGLFQTSWDSHTASKYLPELLIYYETMEALSDTWLDVFQEGVPHITVHNVGAGTGATFQNLSKVCPPFAAEYAAVVVRCLRGHYGTINRYEAEINPQLDNMFKQVETLIETNCTTYSKALLGSKYKETSVTSTPVTPTEPKGTSTMNLEQILSGIWTKNWTSAWSGVVTAAGAVIAVAPQISAVINTPIVASALAAAHLTPVIGTLTAVIGVITYISQPHTITPSK